MTENYELSNIADDGIQNNSIDYEDIYQDLILSYGKRSSVISGFDFKDLTLFSFRFVKETIPDLIKENNVEKIVRLGLKEKGKNFTTATDEELGAFYLWVIDELKRINELEQMLSRPPKPIYVQAGIDSFDVFGVFNVVVGLCEKFGWTEEYVWSKRYDEVFRLQLYGKISADFTEKVQELEKRKSK